MSLIIAMPIFIAFSLVATLWFQHQKKSKLSLVLLIVSILTALSPNLYHQEAALFLMSGMFIGWFISLIPNKDAQEFRKTKILKLVLSCAFLFGAICFIIAGPMVGFVLRNNYYGNQIIQGSILIVVIIFVGFLVSRIKKIMALEMEE